MKQWDEKNWERVEADYRDVIQKISETEPDFPEELNRYSQVTHYRKKARKWHIMKAAAVMVFLLFSGYIALMNPAVATIAKELPLPPWMMQWMGDYQGYEKAIEEEAPRIENLQFTTEEHTLNLSDIIVDDEGIYLATEILGPDIHERGDYVPESLLVEHEEGNHTTILDPCHSLYNDWYDVYFELNGVPMDKLESETEVQEGVFKGFYKVTAPRYRELWREMLDGNHRELDMKVRLYVVKAEDRIKDRETPLAVFKPCIIPVSNEMLQPSKHYYTKQGIETPYGRLDISSVKVTPTKMIIESGDRHTAFSFGMEEFSLSIGDETYTYGPKDWKKSARSFDTSLLRKSHKYEMDATLYYTEGDIIKLHVDSIYHTEPKSYEIRLLKEPQELVYMGKTFTISNMYIENSILHYEVAYKRDDYFSLERLDLGSGKKGGIHEELISRREEEGQIRIVQEMESVIEEQESYRFHLVNPKIIIDVDETIELTRP